MTHGLFSSMLFSFQVFGDFPDILVLLIINSVVTKKHTFYDLPSLAFIETCFIAYLENVAGI